MKKLNQFITEKLKINSKMNVDFEFTDEELRKDFKSVGGAYSKSEKLPYMQKYDVTENKVEAIQNKILKLLRDNRHNKDKFDAEDATYFYRMHIPDVPYKKSEAFFKQEPFEFIEYLKSYFENESQPFKRAKQSFNRFGMARISIADRHQINMYNNVIKYLEENK